MNCLDKSPTSKVESFNHWYINPLNKQVMINGPSLEFNTPRDFPQAYAAPPSFLRLHKSCFWEAKTRASSNRLGLQGGRVLTVPTGIRKGSSKGSTMNQLINS